MARWNRALPVWLLLSSLLPAGSGKAQEGEPHLADAALEAAAGAVRDGRVERALELLEGAEGAAPGYLRARLLERKGEHAAAAAALAELSGEAFESLPRAVRGDVAERRALALARAGDCEDAVRLLAELDSGLARAMEGECLLRLGEHRRAIRELRAALQIGSSEVDSFALRYELAEALLAIGRRSAGRRELVRLWVEESDHPDIELVREILDENGGLPDLSEEETLDRADSLMRAWRPAEAAALLEGRPPRNRARRARWLHLRGMALFRTRNDYAEAAQVLRRAARVGGPTAIADEFHSARALGRADRDVAAIRGYRRLARRHPRHRYAARAEYLAAWLELRMDHHSGERRMEAFLEGPRASLIPSLRREATWQLGLRAFEKEQWARAARLLGRYARMGSGPMEEGRGQYWRARALEQDGETDEATEAYRAARAIDPLHYYGVLAGSRLEALGVDEPPPLNDPPDAPPEMQITLPDAARFYLALGLDADAAAAVRRAERNLRRQAPSGRVNETVVRAHMQARSHSRAYRLASLEHDRLRMKPEGSAQWAWEAAYPRPAFDTVVRESRRRGLPWSLPYAIMRQESGYDPDAVSHAGAVGLMQVMPEVGAGLGGDEFGVDLLFVPEQNVRLGIAELAGKVRAMEGSIPLAIAGYNAGSARVRRWLRETGEVPFDLWVEKMSFDETRNYVRRVLSHLARYRFIATGEVSLPVPERVAPLDGAGGEGDE